MSSLEFILRQRQLGALNPLTAQASADVQAVAAAAPKMFTQAGAYNWAAQIVTAEPGRAAAIAGTTTPGAAATTKDTATLTEQYKTGSGWDLISSLFGLPGILYSLGQAGTTGQRTQQVLTGTGELGQTIVDKVTTPAPAAATTGGMDWGSMGGLIDKVIVAGVVLGAIGLLKGVFK